MRAVVDTSSTATGTDLTGSMVICFNSGAAGSITTSPFSCFWAAADDTVEGVAGAAASLAAATGSASGFPQLTSKVTHPTRMRRSLVFKIDLFLSKALDVEPLPPGQKNCLLAAPSRSRLDNTLCASFHSQWRRR